MQIKWFGHACFKLTSASGVVILIDPFDDSIGYKVPDSEADIVTVSHGHYDHSNTEILKGDYTLLNKVGNFNVKDIPISGIQTYHDDEQGAKRGVNIAYVFEIDGLRICHLGDLGHLLLKSHLDMLGRVDVLMVPVGGVYTIDAKKAKEIVDQLKPAIAIPMHYKTPALNFELGKAEDFINSFSEIERPETQEIEFHKDNIDYSKQTVYLMKYE